MNDSDERLQELSPADRELSQHLRATLDESVDTLDELTQARLMRMRQHALAKSKDARPIRRRVVVALATAAGLAAIALMPGVWNTGEPAPVDYAYLSVDPDMLSDMDMLLAIGEVE